MASQPAPGLQGALGEFLSQVFGAHHYQPENHARSVARRAGSVRTSSADTIPERSIPIRISGLCGFGSDKCTADVCDERMRLAKMAAEAEFDDTGATELAYSAEKRAIHEAWKHARKAQDAAKEAADAAMQAVEETARVQKFLDPHDVIKVEEQTEMDVKKEELASGTVRA